MSHLCPVKWQFVDLNQYVFFILQIYFTQKYYMELLMYLVRFI